MKIIAMPYKSRMIKLNSENNNDLPVLQNIRNKD